VAVTLTVFLIVVITLGVAIGSGRRWGLRGLLFGFLAGAIVWRVASIAWLFWFTNG
jgi:hypothetical protein